MVNIPPRPKLDPDEYKAWRQIAAGQVNTRGEFVLSGAGSVTVASPYVSPDSVVLPMATSAAGKAAVFYIVPADQQFVVHHDTVTDTATFAYVSLGVAAPD